MNLLFFNDVGRLRSGWRFLIFVFAFLFVLTAISGFLLTFAEQFPKFKPYLAGRSSFIVQNGATLLIAAALGIILQRFVEDLPARTLGWNFKFDSLKYAILGFFIGAATLLIAVGIVFVSGSINFRANETDIFSAVLNSFLVSLTIFLLGSAAEETLFRGYAMQTFTRARLAWLAVILTSLPFALIHLGNPNVAPVFTFLNTALAGVWLAAAYLKTRSLWFPFAVHFAWNWIMNQFFGIPVSGLTLISPAPFLRYSDSNNAVWLSGGDYGIEGGAACTAALVVSTLFIWFAPFLKPDAELLALTSRENPARTENSRIV